MTASEFLQVIHPTPVGILRLSGSQTHLLGIQWQTDHERFAIESGSQYRDGHWLLTETQRQLEAYFEGKRQQFDLPIAPMGTPFQQRVWQTVQRIPYGHTHSYTQVAQQLQKPNASRAVGLANAKNPLPIIIPCHRLIGQNRNLKGYIGGLDAKQYLLNLEQH